MNSGRNQPAFGSVPPRTSCSAEPQIQRLLEARAETNTLHLFFLVERKYLEWQDRLGKRLGKGFRDEIWKQQRMLLLLNWLSTYKTTVTCYCPECAVEGDIAIPMWESENKYFGALNVILICTTGYQLLCPSKKFSPAPHPPQKKGSLLGTSS